MEENKKVLIFKVFSEILLDIEGSNLSKTGWEPSKDDKKYMDEQNYQYAIAEYKRLNEKVIFKNVFLDWDSCDCGDGYGCSHVSYVYEINVLSNGKNINIEYTDGDSLEFHNEGNYCKIPTNGATIYDFIRMCEICKIDLEFTDYAISLINEAKANALLISKAPEMLEMLNYSLEAIKAINSFGATKPIIDRIEKLIKEATELQ